MIIDTHAHLYYEELLNQIDDVVKRAEDAGLEKIIVPAVDYNSSLTILELADKYKMIYGLVGVHPTEVQKVGNDELDKIYKLLDNGKNKKIVGIGEAGLDYFWDKSYIEKQKDFLRKQIEIAKEKITNCFAYKRFCFRYNRTYKRKFGRKFNRSVSLFWRRCK